MVDKAQQIRDFFDRDYTKREAYRRVWEFIRPFKFRLFAGIFCGMCTAGTLVPVFQLVRPSVVAVEQSAVHVKDEKIIAAEEKPVVKETARADASTPKEFRELEKYAKKFGLTVTDSDGVMRGGIILLLLIVVPLVAAARLALKFLNHYCLSWVGTNATMNLSCALLKHAQKQSLQFYSRIDIGRLMSRIMADPIQVRTIVQSVISDLAEAPFEIAVSIGYVVWYAIVNEMIPTLILILVAFPMFVIPIRSTASRIRKWTRTTLMMASAVLGRVHDVLTCIKLVKSADTEEYENRKYASANKMMVKVQLRSIRIMELVKPMMEYTGVIIICLFVCWCFAKGITLDRVLPMLAPLLVIYKPMKKLAKLQVVLENSMAALSRIFSLLDLHMEVEECDNPVRKDEFVSAVRFEDVSFRYDTQDHDAVSHATFEVPKGSKVAVVGGTGSGKSTLALLFARFADPREGRVLIDGVDLRDVATEDLRRLIGVVNQETLLFNEPIAYNVAYGKPGAALEEIEAAAKLANAHEFIVSQPYGYARLCGEKGFALSGGERQRVSIACAILRNPPILILDEATSALDNITEKLVQDALENLMKNRTTFVIAHRLSTIKDADLILVMDNGSIVERGTHEELYAAGGVYRKLCDMQNHG